MSQMTDLRPETLAVIREEAFKGNIDLDLDLDLSVDQYWNQD